MGSRGPTVSQRSTWRKRAQRRPRGPSPLLTKTLFLVMCLSYLFLTLSIDAKKRKNVKMSVDVGRERERDAHTHTCADGRERNTDTTQHPLLFYWISTSPVTAEHRLVHPQPRKPPAPSGCSQRDATRRGSRLLCLGWWLRDDDLLLSLCSVFFFLLPPPPPSIMLIQPLLWCFCWTTVLH